MKLNKQMISLATLAVGGMAILGIFANAGCSSGGSTSSTSGSPVATGTTGAPATNLKGAITIDGSSTVYPISQAMAEEFMKLHKDVDITVNQSGTGGGMKKFVAGEIDICDASRPIEQEEIDKAKEKGIEFVELPVAFDGLSVVVNKENAFVDSLTVDELKKMWEPASEGKVMNWSQIRAGFPNEPIKLFGAGTDSGTFEYFTEAIVKQKKAARTDVTVSENDNDLVTGVKGSKGGLGYFGYAYYLENKADLKIVKIDGGAGPVEPTEATINDGTYTPLSRPIFIYVRKSSLEKPEVKEFINYYLSAKGQEWINETGYVALPAKAYELALKHATEMTTGTRFNGVQPGMKVEEVLAKDGS